MTTRAGHSSHRTIGSIALAVALAAGAMGAAHAKGGNAGGGGGGGAAENVGGAMFSCSGGGEVGSAGVNRSGNRLTVAVGMANDVLGADWTIAVTDNGVAAGTLQVAYPGVSWSTVQTLSVGKGQHVVGVNATSDAGESCTGTFTVKV